MNTYQGKTNIKSIDLSNAIEYKSTTEYSEYKIQTEIKELLQ